MRKPTCPNSGAFSVFPILRKIQSHIATYSNKDSSSYILIGVGDVTLDIGLNPLVWLIN